MIEETVSLLYAMLYSFGALFVSVFGGCVLVAFIGAIQNTFTGWRDWRLAPITARVPGVPAVIRRSPGRFRLR